MTKFKPIFNKSVADKWWESSHTKRYLDYMGIETWDDLEAAEIFTMEEKFIERASLGLDDEQRAHLEREFHLYLNIKENKPTNGINCESKEIQCKD